jgi:ammonia channel protein AmtB
VNPAGADGLLGGNPRLVLTQAVAVVSTILYTAPVTALVLSRLRVVGSLRVPLPDELTGVDLAEHGEHAYHDGDAAGGGIAGGRTRIGDGVLLPSPAEWAAAKADAA